MRAPPLLRRVVPWIVAEFNPSFSKRRSRGATSNGRAKARPTNMAPGFARGSFGVRVVRGRKGGRYKGLRKIEFVAAAFAAAFQRRLAFPGHSPGPRLYGAPSRAIRR